MGSGLGAVADGGRKAWADPGQANAAWLSWWPLNLGRSWLVDAAQLGPSGYALGAVGRGPVGPLRSSLRLTRSVDGAQVKHS